MFDGGRRCTYRAGPPVSHRTLRRPMKHPLAALALAAGLVSPAFAAEPVRVLFVGNSYTFGRADPVMRYAAASVHDLTAGFNAANPAGTNSHPPGTPGAGSFEPHPWGGVPALFKAMTEQAGLAWDVSLSTRNAASLRGHFLQTYNADWPLRSNVARQRWDVVVLQEQSDAALPAGRSRNANLAAFNAYADRFERFIHDGGAQRFTEAELHGSLAACQAAGLSEQACTTPREIAANPQASAATRVYLEQTWARPDMVEAHAPTRPDLDSPDGRPKAEHRSGARDAARYYDSLAAMTADLHAAFFAAAARNPGFTGVVPVGDAFQRAVDQGLAAGRGFYGADGRAAEPEARLDLWWLDRTHASKHGSYLAALTLFGRLTGHDPRALGAGERAAADLGIRPADAVALQRVASEQLGFTPTAAGADLSPGTPPGSAPAR